MIDLIVQFQNTIITMYQNNRLTEEEFEILAGLSENISDEMVLNLIMALKAEDLKDKDIVDCIINKHYKTALQIVT
ncbi:MAG: hypothetical protein AWM53_02011 [Candidatus Dichloromethanomonas elyunquensis]|nr:MAG: hypothetical protein AWM53_02011 [Candidatus Dichloromethanomonas elyunquensis]